MSGRAGRGGFRLRHQLPVFSPLRFGDVVRASRTGRGADPVEALSGVLIDDFNARDVVLCGSGTQALQLAIGSALEATGSRQVALPGFCCYDVAAAAIGADARVALYDIDPATLSPDLESLERVLRSGTRVVVVAHLYGTPVDWDAVVALADRYEAAVIEDAAQGQGGAWRGRPLGSLGDCSVLSFGRGKGWTGGGGGALLLRDAAAPGLLAPARPGGGIALKSVAQWLLGRPAIYGIPSSIPQLGLGETRYHAPTPPAGIARFSAALALASREDSRNEAAARRINGAALEARLRGAEGCRLVLAVEGGAPGYLRLPVRIRGGIDAFSSPEEALRVGIGRSYPTTLRELPELCDRLVERDGALPGAETLVSELVTLPTHSRLSEAEGRTVMELVAAGRVIRKV